MKFYKDALALKLLQHLSCVGAIPRKDLYAAFLEYEYTSFAKVVKRLIEEGYVSLQRHNRINYVMLSKKGLVVADAKKGQTHTPVNNATRKRQQLVAPVLNACVAAGIHTTDKPELKAFYLEGRSYQPEEEKVDLDTFLEEGIFYSSGEIRAAHEVILGKSEIANWTRLIGVVLHKGNLVFLYNINKELIKWVVGCEMKAIDTIMKFFRLSKILSSRVDLDESPSCIVFGRGTSMIPKLVFGRRWGRIEEGPREKYRAKIASDHINSHNLAKIFAAAYYVPLGARYIGLFKMTLLLNPGSKDAMCDAWFSRQESGVLRLNNLPYHQGIGANRQRVIYMPYIDLVELEFYRNQAEPCHMVIPSGMQDACSRVLGPCLRSADNLRGERLQFAQYSGAGEKIKTAME